MTRFQYDVIPVLSSMTAGNAMQHLSIQDDGVDPDDLHDAPSLIECLNDRAEKGYRLINLVPFGGGHYLILEREKH